MKRKTTEDLADYVIKRHKVEISHKNIGKGTSVPKSVRKKLKSEKRPDMVESRLYKNGKLKDNVIVDNKPSRAWDSGHMNAKNNGGKGTLDNLFIQNRKTNRGGGVDGKDWRRYEDRVTQLVAGDKK